NSRPVCMACDHVVSSYSMRITCNNSACCARVSVYLRVMIPTSRFVYYFVASLVGSPGRSRIPQDRRRCLGGPCSGVTQRALVSTLAGLFHPDDSPSDYLLGTLAIQLSLTFTTRDWYFATSASLSFDYIVPHDLICV